MRVSLRVRTVQKQQVVMQVQVECTTETLNQWHRACLTCLSTEACLLDQPTRQATIDQSQHATHHRWPNQLTDLLDTGSLRTATKLVIRAIHSRVVFPTLENSVFPGDNQNNLIVQPDKCSKAAVSDAINCDPLNYVNTLRCLGGNAL